MVQSTDFIYHNIELYKSESLGSGSYGGVCKAKCDGLLCAAKIMHPTLFDLRDPGTETYLRKFQEECHLLSLARHPTSSSIWLPTMILTHNCLFSSWNFVMKV